MNKGILQLNVAQKDQENKENSDHSKDSWGKTITIAIVVALCTTILNYSLWKVQFSEQKENELLKAKIAALEKITESTIYYLYLKPFRIRMRLRHSKAIENYMLETKQKPSIEKSMQFIKEIEKKHPFEYKKMLQCDEFSPKMKASLMIARAYFSKNVWESISRLENLYDEEFLYNRYIKENNKKYYNEIVEREILEYFNSQSEKEFETLINQIYKETID